MTKARCLLLALALSGCWSSTKAYRDTWEPYSIETQGLRPRLLTSAIILKGSDDIERLKSAGAELIGWHSATRSIGRSEQEAPAEPTTYPYLLLSSQRRVVSRGGRHRFAFQVRARIRLV